MKLLSIIVTLGVCALSSQGATNPIIWADVPDCAMLRVGDTYYMSSTTMHLSPGLPIMKSKDLVHWEIASYAYNTLGDNDNLTLRNGKNAYGAGSWASSLQYHEGTYFATTFSSTTGKTYIFSTRDIDGGKWKEQSFYPAFHDHTLVFDDDGKKYLIYGAGDIRLVELKADLSGVEPNGVHQVIIPNASLVAGENVGLPAEGSQLLKKDGKYYLFNIVWPRGGMRTVIVHRADKITGPYEGRVAFRDRGIAQGSLIETPQGDWYAYLFQDAGAVGRIPYLVPAKWEDGWCVLGVDGKAPAKLELLGDREGLPGVVCSDDFGRELGTKSNQTQDNFPLAWQWNHNPDDRYWSLEERFGFLRLKTCGEPVRDVTQARNTLTQRTFGPKCAGTTLLDASAMRVGDNAGLVLLQKEYGWIGVRRMENSFDLVAVNAKNEVVESVALEQTQVFLRSECNFANRADTARFFYSLDGKDWRPIGTPLRMVYTLPHFMGYRFGLFNFATQAVGGYADFDFFHIEELK